MSNYKEKRDRAVSEVVAAILLIGLAVTGIAIVSVLLISSPPPSDIPKSNIQISYDSQNPHVFFYHSGGDPIERNSIKIKADDVLVDPSKISVILNINGTPSVPIPFNSSPQEWNYSTTLMVAEDPGKRYQILYSSGSGGEHLFKEFHKGDVSTGKTTITADCSQIDNPPDFSFSPSPATNTFDYRLISSFVNKDPKNWTSFYIVDGKIIEGWEARIQLPVSAGKEEITYSVQRVVTNKTSDNSVCERSAVRYIPVQCTEPICSADFTYIKDGADVRFTDRSLNAISWTWNMGDGNVISGNTSAQQNPVHTYTDNIFEHDVELTVITKRCGEYFTCSTKRKVSTESVNCGCFNWVYNESTRNPWWVDFYWNPENSDCTGLYGTNPKKWKVTFDFGDGSSATYISDASLGVGIPEWPLSNRLTHPYTAICKGSYSVKMQVEDMSGGIYYSCIRTVTLPCLCISDPPVANFTATAISPTNLVTLITDDSSAAAVSGRSLLKWEYDFGDGTPVSTSPSKPTGLTHTYASCGNYVITLNVFDSMNCWTSTTRTVSCGGGGCEPGDITASFNYDPAPSQKREFTFTDTSSSVNTIQGWEWDFGDGVSSTDQNPVHTYADCGSYPVKLRVRDNIGCWDDVVEEVTCDCPKPTAAFRIDTMPNPKSFQFIDETTYNPSKIVIDSYQWDFGDGVSSPQQNPVHVYNTCGQYTVRLKVTSDCGSWDDTTLDAVCGCNIPNASFRIDTTDDPRMFSFSDTSTSGQTITSWDWDFGDGNTTSGQYVSHRYADCGSYPVRLKVTTSCGSSAEAIQNAICGCSPPIAAFTIETTDIPEQFRFINQSTSDTPIQSIYWDFGDGTTSTENNPTHTYPRCGQYTVRLKVTNDCGATGDTIQDAVCGCQAPIPSFEYQCVTDRQVVFTDLSRSSGGSISSWRWDFGDGTISSQQNPTHEYGNPGTYPVNLTVNTTCGSSASWTRQVTVPCCQMPVPDFTYTCHEDGNTIRFNDTTKIFGDTITRWNWNFGDGVGTSSSKDPLYRYSMPGTYPVNLTITTECGAQNSWIHNVTVPCLCSPPIANFTKEMVSSKPFTMRFTDNSIPNSNSITSWNWSFGDATTYSGQNPPDKTYTTCGEYLVNLRVTNDCGQFDDMDQLICCPVFANFTYRQDPPDGDAPVTVYFTDLSEGMPNAWSWDFGDGHTSYLQNPVHIFTDGGNFTVTLHATSPCGGNETHSKVLTFGCPDITADFSYTIISEEPFHVSFTDLSFGGEIVDWTWFFGDGTTSKEQHPVHLYGGRANYNVGLIVKNNCGNTAQIWRRIAFDCPNLTADFNRTPVSGMNPLEVKFEDNSTPLDKIMSWLWFFGDGTSYYTTSPSSRHPPNHTYTKIGTYYVTIQIKNECGNPFSTVKTVNVTSPASISGYVWNDKNMSKIREPNEAGLANWEVTLQERVAGGWVDRDNALTNATGYYSFNMDGVTYGAFRVRETLQPRWNATYSYPFGDESPESGTLLISSTRHYNDVNFGNVRTNTSTFEFPLRFYYGEVGTGYGGTTYNMNERDKYWDYNTSFNWERQKLLYPPPYLISYTAQGDSSFDVTIGFYARYLIFLSSGNRPPISRSYWLRYWLYPPNAGGTRTNGFTFFVPDNTDIYRPDLFFERDDVRWFELYIPFEGSTIPYSTNSYVEAHMTGTGGSTTGCTLTAPVTMSLTWTTTHGYFTGNWDNTPYEGQWITITARNDFGTGGSPRYITSSKNVFVDWQPVSPLITSPTNNTIVQGTANIIATVGGHNRDTDNVRLYVDDNDVGQLVYDSGSNIFANTLSVEQYAGKTIKVVARAYPIAGRGDFVDSTPIYLRVRSIEPIQANFVAEPWNGPAPLEVVFTDTSTGGPSAWLWNFADGFSSTEREPVHIFQTPGNYSVSLQVTNIMGATSVISRYVNTTGVLNTVNLLTNRNGYLHPGYASWRVRGEGSTITVNGTEYLLVNGDRVRLDIGTPQTNVNIRVVGEINSFNVTDVTLSVNGNPIDTGTCSDIRIRDFDNYHSDLRITTYRQSNAWINLIWNAFPVTIQNYQNLDISELLPSADKIMEIIFEPGNIFFDGRASSYRLYS